MATDSAQHSAQVVGNAFVQQYYHILHQSPELVYRFYQENSKLGRPQDEGVMSSVTTLQTINEKLLSLAYGEYKAEIKTVDSQESLNGGVLVLVTGYLTGEDGLKRKFTQLFFLATQDKGYFVLNDILRFVEDSDDQQASQVVEFFSETTHEQDGPPPEERPDENPLPREEGEEEVNVGEVYNPSDVDEGSIVDEELPSNNVVLEVAIISNDVSEPSDIVKEEAPKKSYASIVKVKKESSVHTASARTLAPPGKVPPNQQWQATFGSAPSSSSENPSSRHSVANSMQEVEANGFSIYIKNLPLNATPAQLEEEFKKYGPIKRDGVQVRSHKQGFCFGFVEFEVAGAVQSAIKDSPIMIGGRQAFVEEKRPSSSGSNKSQFIPGRGGGGFRNEGPRGRGTYGVRGYGRGDFIHRNDFGNRVSGRGAAIRRDGTNQRFENGFVNRPQGYSSNVPSKGVAHWVPTT